MDSLSGAEIREALEELSDELKRNRVKGRLYLAGGAAIALAFRDSRRTYDLDALILEGHGPVTEAARRVGRKRGWPDRWLNEEATSFPPKSPDHRAQTVFGSSHLVVTAASAEHLLAMKVRAGRLQALPDVEILADSLGIQSVARVFEVHDEVFPRNPVPAGARERVEHFLANRWQDDSSLDRDARGQPSC